jgi:exonuclease III
MEKEIIIWNINQRNNYKNKDYIPSLVASSIKDKGDVIILTEFYKTSNWIKELGEKLSNYNVFVSNNATNQILIATKKDMNVKEICRCHSSYMKSKPDYLAVTIEVIDGEETFDLSIVGTRILVDYYNYKKAEEVNAEMTNRKKQCDFFIDKIKELEDKGNMIIGGGDFNTARRDNPNKYWNKEILSVALGDNIQLYTPEGYSHKPYMNEYAGCPDHIFYSKKIKVKVQPYNWDFVKVDTGIYNKGEFTEDIDNPYPDHAMIKATFII